MFLTVNQNQLPTLAGPEVRAWRAVELEFNEPLFLCSWARQYPAGAAQGTAVVLLEQDLKRWISQPEPFELRHLQMLEPSHDGHWQLRDISRVWQGSRRRSIVLEDGGGTLFTVDQREGRPLVGALLWKYEPIQNVVHLAHRHLRESPNDDGAPAA